MYLNFRKYFQGALHHCIVSQLKRIKDVKRSTMHQQRLGALALLFIKSALLREVDLSSVIEEFAVVKARKVTI